jgi:hypothetical protein
MLVVTASRRASSTESDPMPPILIALLLVTALFAVFWTT